MVKPHRAYFGQKDFQQCVVIKRMVTGLNMDVEVIVLPTVREADGLAMSSRNSYLNAEERPAATVLFTALTAARDLFRTGVTEPEKLKNTMSAVIQGVPGITIDYVEIADSESLVPLLTASNSMVMLIAVRLGSTRLIDNMMLP